jgi:IstB-like ATP binding protein
LIGTLMDIYLTIGAVLAAVLVAALSVITRIDRWRQRESSAPESANGRPCAAAIGNLSGRGEPAARTIADAVLDRLVHNAHRLALEGDSMRKITAQRASLDAAKKT